MYVSISPFIYIFFLFFVGSWLNFIFSDVTRVHRPKPAISFQRHIFLRNLTHCLLPCTLLCFIFIFVQFLISLNDYALLSIISRVNVCILFLSLNLADSKIIVGTKSYRRISRFFLLFPLVPFKRIHVFYSLSPWR